MNEMRGDAPESQRGPAPAARGWRAVTSRGPLVLLLGVIAALCVWSGSGAPPALGAAILIAFVIACWVFGLFPEPVTSLVFILVVILFHISKPEVVLSGFVSQAWWLVFGGSIIAIAVQTTGLGRRLAGALFARSGGSYARAVAAVAIAAVGLAFVMPSTNGRILLLTPIVLAFAEHLGLTPGRPGHTGLIVTVGAASYMAPTAILPANVPNSILLGASQSLYGIDLTYGPYLLLHFPILGALKTVVLIWLVCRLFPESGRLKVAAAHHVGPMSREEKWLTALLLLSLLLFATDFLHGISPAWISLGTGILCMLPPVIVVTPKALSERVNLSMLMYIGGILGLGAVVSDTGLGQFVASHLMAWAQLTPGHTAVNLATLAGIGAGLAGLVTVTGLPAVLTPLAKEFSDASGLPLLTVLMLQVPVFSTVFLPFESPPMMVGLQVGGVSPRPAGKLCLALAAITLVVLLPLDYLWWRLLGYLP